MDIVVYVAVLTAAALHAVWNAFVKGAADKHVSMAAVVLGHAPISLAVLAFVPMPDPASWPYLLCGAALHTAYQLFLLASYRIGDLTQVYPIARGTAPMLVAGISVMFLGVELSTSEVLAVITIGVGIMSLSVVRQSDGLRNPHAAQLAFATGCFIAGYSLIDGLGARQAGTALGFYAWLALFNAASFAAIMGVTRPGVLTRLRTDGRRALVLGGSASFGAYALVIWAFTQAPIALVTALRETSIVFALLIGVFFLKEKLDLAKLVSVAVTLFGAILLRFSR
ncbi:MAG: EamA family transporter [Hyphomicrobiales bacterium]